MTQRPSPTILHVDMDAFFASVEVLDDPSLAGLPVIVGGAGARGVVASCTYEARAFGVRSAMPSVRARQLCPQAIFLPGRHRRYAEISGRLHRDSGRHHANGRADRPRRSIPGRRGAIRMLGHPEKIAHGLRDRVRTELSLDCAVGIGRSKMIANLASRAAKPRASRTGPEPGPGVVLIESDVELAFLHDHKVEALWGVGPATSKRLHELGVRTVGDLAAIPGETLVRRLGKASGLHLVALARRRGPQSCDAEPTCEIDRPRGDFQSGPRRHSRTRAPCAAYGGIGCHHVAGFVHCGPHGDGEGQVPRPLFADPVPHVGSGHHHRWCDRSDGRVSPGGNRSR